MGRAAEIAREQEYVSRLYDRLDVLREQTRRRLVAVRRAGASGTHQARSERDAFATMYENRLATLDAVEPNLCFGRLDLASGERLHVGRIGLTDDRHDTLLVDWRAPAAEPFYRATPADAHGVVRRRHLRTRGRAVVDVEDDVFDITDLTEADRETLGGGGALLAALTVARTGRMRDIVATIQAEQDRVIRAEPTGVLVVQGGPGTGKTAVALHRAAYLLYTHRERLTRSGVLVIGPGPTFLRYIEQVLPSLGETGVLLSTLAGLLPAIQVSATEPVAVAARKAEARLADVIAAAIADRQRVPARPVTVDFEQHELVLTPADVAAARSRARRTRRRHNRARYAFAKHLLRLAVGRLAEVEPELAGQRWVVREIMASESFRAVVDECWPRLSATEVVRDVLDAEGFGTEGFGTAGLGAAGFATQGLGSAAGWTAADVPLLDEARARLGDPEEVLRLAAQRRQRRLEREYAREVLAAGGLAGQVDAGRLADRFADPGTAGASVADRAAEDPDWEFGHVIVDEAQELSPMAWRMVARRCPAASMTVVGDVAQTSAPWGARCWDTVLAQLAPGRSRVRELTVNYRTPSEVMAVAADVLAAVDPAAQPPTSVRDAGDSPLAHQASDAAATAVAVAAAAREQLPDGKLALLCPAGPVYDAVVPAAVARFGSDVATGAEGLDAPVAVLTIAEAKGLEFDAVVVVEPADWLAAGDSGLRDLYVALTRTTQRLDVVYTGELPAVLRGLATAAVDR